MGGITLAWVSKSGDSNLPKAIVPTAPGKTSSAGTATNESVNEAATVPILVCRCHWIAPTLARGKLAMIVADAGVLLIVSRIFSSTAVALCVLNTLAVTMAL